MSMENKIKDIQTEIDNISKKLQYLSLTKDNVDELHELMRNPKISNLSKLVKQ